jgi:hypothetical protein
MKPAAREHEKPRSAGLSECAEEDSNLHPVSPDQALNPVHGCMMLGFRAAACVASTAVDALDMVYDVDVATDVATATSHGVMVTTMWAVRAVPYGSLSFPCESALMDGS